ncbi:PREDICTED: disks large homolog 3, partial [Tinamus guttatus]|uniref:disks large homolog 3 n=1 Tax=Tinamus guttatus TaxID=94827 RepID=UPI00052F2093
FVSSQANPAPIIVNTDSLEQGLSVNGSDGMFKYEEIVLERVSARPRSHSCGSCQGNGSSGWMGLSREAARGQSVREERRDAEGPAERGGRAVAGAVIALLLVAPGWVAGLGFSIAGGIGNQHIPGDNSIYITKIIEGGAAQKDGRLQIGDRLLAVSGGTRGDRAAFSALPDNHISHNSSLGYLGSVESKPPYPVAPQVTPSRYSPIPRHMLGDEDFTRGGTAVTAAGELSSMENIGDHIQEPQPPEPVLVVFELVAGLSRGHFQLVAGAAMPGARGEQSRAAPGTAALPGSAGLCISRRIRKDRILPPCMGTASRDSARDRGDTGSALTLSLSRPSLLPVARSGRGSPVPAWDARVGDGPSAPRAPALTLPLSAEYSRFESKIHDLREQMMNSSMSSGSGSLRTSEKRSLYVRALFDYDRTRDSCLPSQGLSFSYGDILHVINASDDEWWQARLVTPHGESEQIGVIPSKKRVEKKERARLKTVKFHARTGMIESNRDFPGLSDDYYGAKNLSKSHLGAHRSLGMAAAPGRVLGPRTPSRSGGGSGTCAGWDTVALPCPERTRLPAGAGLLPLEGWMCWRGKHCILDVSGNAIKRLQQAQLYPIAIFIKPKSIEALMEMNRRQTYEQANKVFDKAMKLEQEFGEYFTAIVQGDSLEEIYSKIKQIIEDQSGHYIWVPSLEKL